jgi:hypothetical protein
MGGIGCSMLLCRVCLEAARGCCRFQPLHQLRSTCCTCRCCILRAHYCSQLAACPAAVAAIKVTGQHTLQQPAGLCCSRLACCAHTGTCHHKHSCPEGSTCTPAQQTEQCKLPCRMQACNSKQQHAGLQAATCLIAAECRKPWSRSPPPVMIRLFYCGKSDIDHHRRRRLACNTCTTRCRHSGITGQQIEASIRVSGSP